MSSRSAGKGQAQSGATSVDRVSRLGLRLLGWRRRLDRSNERTTVPGATFRSASKGTRWLASECATRRPCALRMRRGKIIDCHRRGFLRRSESSPVRARSSAEKFMQRLGLAPTRSRKRSACRAMACRSPRSSISSRRKSLCAGSDRRGSSPLISSLRLQRRSQSNNFPLFNDAHGSRGRRASAQGFSCSSFLRAATPLPVDPRRREPRFLPETCTDPGLCNHCAPAPLGFS